MAEPPSPLVSVSWLAAHMEDPRVVVADVRWYLSGKRGADEYARGHLPGAVFVDVDGELSSPPAPDRPGRHPLPSAAQVSALLWLLRYFGHGGGRVLDGGLQAWVAGGGPISTHVPAPRRTPPLALAPDPRMVVDRRAVAALAGSPSALVLDARAPERFEGKVEPIDARPGHVPGARSAPFTDNLVAPEGTFRDRADLARRYGALGATGAATIVAYCGSGITACHDLLALALIGRPDALLYEGSWSDWARDPALPAALGGS
jgi:thiosulfate/3-mercaptopyruvate sulfurtransferase